MYTVLLALLAGRWRCSFTFHAFLAHSQEKKTSCGKTEVGTYDSDKLHKA